VVRHFASKCGVELPAAPRRADKELAWRGWNERLVRYWCHLKGGIITEEAVRQCGGRLAGYPKKTGEHAVLCLPCYGPHLLNDDPTNYIMAATSGQPIPIFAGPGKPKRPVKYPVQAECPAGWVGHWGLARLAEASCVWKVEGVTDLLAMQSIIPPELLETHVVVTESSGAGAPLPTPHLKPLSGKRVLVLHDADVPGEKGAARRMLAFTEAGAMPVVVRLPFEIAESHGKDLKDWLTDWLAMRGGQEWTPDLRRAAYRELLAMAESQAVAAMSSCVEEGSAAAPPSTPDPLGHYREVCEKLGVEVLGEWPNQEIEVYSLPNKKTRRIKNVGKLDFPNLAQLCGLPVSKYVNPGGTDIPDMFKMSQVKEAIAMMASGCTLSEGSIKGRGAWRGTNDLGVSTEEIVLVGAGEALKWDGRRLERLSRPRCGQMVLQLSGHSPWFEHVQLEDFLARSESPEWCQAVIDETAGVFRGWRWQEGIEPLLVTGLVLATWVQSLWAWRPQVIVIGESNSGKTFLFKTLRGLFGGLSMSAIADSTEPGIRQEIGCDSPAVLLDEWDTSKSHERVLSFIRNSSRGERRLTGTTHQKAVHATVQQIFWLAGIVSGLKKTADQNRFIRLELVSPPEGERTLTLRPQAELAELGQRLLAVSLRHALCAVPLAERLRIKHFPGVDSRIVESFSVAGAMLACAGGLNLEQAEALMGKLLVSAREEDRPESDEADVLRRILSATIDGGRKIDRKTVAQMLEFSMDPIEGHLAEDALARVGIKVSDSLPGEPMAPGTPCLAIAPQIVADVVLKGTDLEGKTIGEVLARIKQPPLRAYRDRRRIGGVQHRCVLIPLELIDGLSHGGSAPDATPGF
jgi:hypothetical protein